jgi:hypothetical protein
MALPTLIMQLVGTIMSGPIDKLIDTYVQDLGLRRKLKAEIETNLLTHLGKSLELEQAVVLAELKSEDWLTRSWRPILMLVLIWFLLFAGFILPMADLMAGKTLPFNPRWQALPDGFWSFLSVGVGGYIGGRSLEKIANRQFTLPNAISGRRKP